METTNIMAIELTDTRSSILMPAGRNAIRTATLTAPFTATGVSSGRVTGQPGYVAPQAGHVAAVRARAAKQGSPPRGFLC